MIGLRFTILIIVLLAVASSTALGSFPVPSWVPSSFDCPGPVVGVIDYSEREAYLFPLQRTAKIAIPKSKRAWRTGCALVKELKKDQLWCPTPRMRANNPEARCRGPYSKDKGNPTGAALVSIDFVEDQGDRYLAFHGTDDEKVLGTMATSGCTRTDNETILAIVNNRLFTPNRDYLYYQR